MGARIKVVTADQEQPEQSFAEAARVLLERALSEGANVVLVAWETPDGVTAASVPYAHSVVRGLTDAVYEELHPVMESE